MHVRTLTRWLRELVIGSDIVVRRLIIAIAIAASTFASAEGTEPEQALSTRIAVWRFDALGIEPELVGRLETLFRMELDRLVKSPLPNRRDIDRVVTGDQRECTGEEKCLAAIGKKLGVEVMVTGTVGSMGDNYVLDIKAVDVATAKTLKRISTDPLRGNPDELIDSVRVAAYKLLAPDQLYGSIQIQSDLVGASVELDGRGIGKTPLPRLGVVGKLPLGKHKLHVTTTGYAPFDEDVEVRFQKISQVVVRLLPSTVVIGTGRVERIEKKPFYTRTWFLIGAGVAAIALGAWIGYEAGHVECVNGVTGASC
jgi:hypothetical protein